MWHSPESFYPALATIYWRFHRVPSPRLRPARRSEMGRVDNINTSYTIILSSIAPLFSQRLWCGTKLLRLQPVKLAGYTRGLSSGLCGHKQFFQNVLNVVFLTCLVLMRARGVAVMALGKNVRSTSDHKRPSFSHLCLWISLVSVVIRFGP